MNEVKSQGTGTVPTIDNNSINSDLTAWNKFKILLDQNINSGSPFSNQIVSIYKLIYTRDSTYAGGILTSDGDIHFVLMLVKK